MPVWRDLAVKDLAEALYRDERDIRSLARKAKQGSDRVEWPVLKDRKTGKPITDKDGLAYAVVASPPARRGKPASSRGEDSWAFRRVQPPQRRTLAQRLLLPGSPFGMGHETIKAITAAAGIPPGAPVRALGGARPGEPTQVIAADGPGPVLGMLLRPEGWAGYELAMGHLVEVLVRGRLLLPAKGPIGTGPGTDLLLWDPEASRWRGELVEGIKLLELLGLWGLDHIGDGDEPVAAHIGGNHGLRLHWVSHPES